MLVFRSLYWTLGVSVGLALLAGCSAKQKTPAAGKAHHEEAAGKTHHEEGEEGEEGEEAKVKTDFASYAAAVAALDKHRANLGKLIEAKDLSELHKAAKPIQVIAGTLNKLAAQEGSGVPLEKRKDVNLTAKALAATWDKIDEAGDSGNAAAAKKVYQEIVDLIGKLQQYAKLKQQ